MILFIPVGILICFGLVLAILGRTRFNIIQSWITALIAAISALSGFLIIKFTGIAAWSSAYLNSTRLNNISIKFQISDSNWIFGILLVSLLISYFFNETKQISDKHIVDFWSGALVITAFGLLVILAKSLLAFIFASLVLDIGLLALQLITQKGDEEKRISLINFIFHSIGTFLLLVGMINTGKESSLLMSVGILFRFSDFSSILSDGYYPITNPSQFFFGNLIVPLSTLAFFYGNGITISNFTGISIVLTIWFFFAVSQSIKFFSSKDSLLKQKTWSESFIWLGLYLILTGNTNTIIPFTIALITLSGIQLFFLQRNRLMKISVFILALGFVGFPYTPSYGFWLYPGAQKPVFFLIIYNLILFYLLLSFLYELLFTTKSPKSKEDWTGLFLAGGPVFLLVTSWLLVLWLKPMRIDPLGFIWPSLLMIIYALLFIVKKIAKIQNIFLRLNSKYELTLQKLVRRLLILFSFKWVIKLISAMSKMISELVTLFTRVLEGEGGLLWAFVFLILLSTFFVSSRTP